MFQGLLLDNLLLKQWIRLQRLRWTLYALTYAATGPDVIKKKQKKKKTPEFFIILLLKCACVKFPLGNLLHSDWFASKFLLLLIFPLQGY